MVKVGYQLEAKRARYRRLREAGLCVRCAEPATGSVCGRCRRRVAIRASHARLQAEKVAAARKVLAVVARLP